jgi:DNA polymerase III epsilon subunit-like protein
MASLQDSKALPAIVFDTETTGLPPWHRDSTRLSDWDGCRLVQLAWSTIHLDSQEGSDSAIVKPAGFTIPEKAAEIHGISTERAHAEGRDLEEVLHAFQVTLERYPDATIVAHNLEFDISIITTEAMRLEMPRLLSLLASRPRHCTMLKAVENNTRRRWPKLCVLYKELFDEEPQGTAHDAIWDVVTCAKIYKRQVKLI